MFRRPPGSTRTDPLFPYPTLFRSAVFQFPGGLADHLKEQIGTRECATAEPFVGRQDFPGDQGRAEWAIAWPLWSRSEEHTSELQSLMRNSYAVFCLKKKKRVNTNTEYATLVPL